MVLKMATTAACPSIVPQSSCFSSDPSLASSSRLSWYALVLATHEAEETPSSSSIPTVTSNQDISASKTTTAHSLNALKTGTSSKEKLVEPAIVVSMDKLQVPHAIEVDKSLTTCATTEPPPATVHSQDPTPSVSSAAVVSDSEAMAPVSCAPTKTIPTGIGNRTVINNADASNKSTVVTPKISIKFVGATQKNSKKRVSETPSGNGKAKATSKRKKKRAKKPLSPGQSTGRWTEEEHKAFLRGLATYGNEWKKVAQHIPTRSSSQLRSHAQKYFAKLQRKEDSWLELQRKQPRDPGAATADTLPDFVSVESSSMTTATAGSSSSNFSDQQLTAAVETNGLSQSVKSNVSRILAQPESVKAEVDETMRKLRVRYQLLQLQLQQLEHQQERTEKSAGVATKVVSCDKVIGGSLPTPPSFGPSVASGNLPLRKRFHDIKAVDDSARQEQQPISTVANVQACADDQSSRSLASTLHNEEMIAVNVLQGSLPRATSNDDDNNNWVAAGGIPDDDSDTDEEELMEWAGTMFGINRN